MQIPWLQNQEILTSPYHYPGNPGTSLKNLRSSIIGNYSYHAIMRANARQKSVRALITTYLARRPALVQKAAHDNSRAVRASGKVEYAGKIENVGAFASIESVMKICVEHAVLMKHWIR